MFVGQILMGGVWGFFMVLGIIVGVASVVAMMAIGNGAQSRVTAQIQSMGSNLLFVRPGAATQGGVRGVSAAATLTFDDAVALADPLMTSSVALVAPEVTTGVQLVVNG